MKNALKFLGIIALVAVIGFSFVACGEGADGVDGKDGKDGIDGGGGIIVWDSSTPPKRIGAFLERTTSSGVTTFMVLLPSGYIVRSINSSTAVISATAIYFTQANQQGDPIIWTGNIAFSPTQTVLYNPHSGGTWYRLTDNYPNDNVTGCTSYYDATGNPNSTPDNDNYHKGQTITSAEIGLPNGLTPPLVLKMTE